MTDIEKGYIPALRFNFLTSFYDRIVALTTREIKHRNKLVKQMNIRAGSKVLEIGSGTGSLTIHINMSQPDSQVVGLDADASIIEIAREKAKDKGLDIEFIQGLAQDKHFPDNEFDVVVSSLFFHHLTHEQKRQTLMQIQQILKPQGQLYIMDWGKPSNFLMRLVFFFVQILDGFETTRDNVKGKLPGLIEQSGFRKVKKTDDLNIPQGILVFLITDKGLP